MTKEQDFFLQIIRDHIHNAPTIEPSEIDWDDLFKISQSHQMTAIVFYQCKKFIPSDSIHKYREVYLNTISANAQRKKYIEAFEVELSKQSIQYFLVKGAVISQFYPQELLRTMGDVDVVSGDRERIDALLLNLGWACDNRSEYHEWKYKKSNCLLELHEQLVEFNLVNKNDNPYLVSLLNNPWGYVQSARICLSFHLIYLIFHLRKHMIGCGVGFRQFVDIAITIQQNDSLDWGWIAEKIESTGLSTFANTVFKLIDEWFGIQVPISTDVITEQFFSAATEYIFSNGVFGFDDASNMENRDLRMIMLCENDENKKARLKYLLRSAFPSYELMRKKKSYSYLNNWKWLLPFAWGHRAVCGLFDIEKRRKIVSADGSPTKTFDNKVALLRQWGI